MDRFNAMSVLVAVVRAGSFSGAGRQLRMPVPTVSRKVAELEAHLKVKLLVRSTRKLALTEAGQSYVAACQRILDHVAAAERDAAGEYRAPRGELVLTAPIVLGRLHVLPIVTEFLHAFADVNVRFVLTDGSLDLIGDHIDLAVRIGELPDSRLVAVRVGQVRQVVCASPAYFAEHGVPATPQDLGAHQCVTFTALSSAEAWTFHEGDAPTSVRIRSRLIVNTAEAAIDAAVAGIGIARVVSYQAAESIKSKALAIALQSFEPPPVPVSIVYTGEPPLAAKLRAFLHFATPRLKARLVATSRG